MVNKGKHCIAKYSGQASNLIWKVNGLCLVLAIVHPVVNSSAVHAQDNGNSKNGCHVLKHFWVLDIAKAKQNRKKAKHSQAEEVHTWVVV